MRFSSFAIALMVVLIATDGLSFAQKRSSGRGSSKKSSSSGSYASKSYSKKKKSSGTKKRKTYSSKKASSKSKSVGGGCAATTNKGTACKRSPQEGSAYCWQHTKMYGTEKQEEQDGSDSDEESGADSSN